MLTRFGFGTVARITLLTFLLSFGLVACGDSPTPQVLAPAATAAPTVNIQASVEAQVKATMDAQPTATIVPPTATATLAPTATPVAPPPTIAPTATPVPPTATLATTTVSKTISATTADTLDAVPSYAGASSITVPDSVRSQFSASVSQFSNGMVEAYKTTDDIPKVKSGFESNFKSAGWEDKTSNYSAGQDLSSLDAAGMFVIGYQKGNKAAVIFGVPSTLAAPLGFTGLSSGENIFMVISGNGK